MDDVIRWPANKVVAALDAGSISPVECLDALERRIGEVNAPLNALVTLCFERARLHAKDLLKKPVGQRGLLRGLPLPIKDLTHVSGVRSTHGSLIFKDHVPAVSDILVRHVEHEGGLVYAMSNTPEFGAGAHTFNEVFGVTRNPWDTRLSPAGSSGGAAVALATGMAWLAHGSDFGGSLRNPASFCGVVGLRPSPGRVAASVYGKVDGTLGVEGPMARNVADVALLLDAMSGAETGDPRSLPRDAEQIRTAKPVRPKRIAVSRDLGITPVDPEVANLVMAAARKLERDGVVVEEAHPDMKEAAHCFHVLRAQSFATGMKALLKNHRDKLKPEVIWNIEKGLQLTGAEVADAEVERGAMFRKMQEFFKTYDFLLCPATIVPPFPVEERFVKSCNGIEFETYVDWLLIVAVATLCMCPAISIPCGFTARGLPIGLQVIAPNRQESRLLEGALWMEQVLELGQITPIEPRVRHLVGT